MTGDDSVTRNVEIAFEALKEANRRRDVAVHAMVDYALEAYVRGEPVEAIMDACGFPEDGERPSSPILALFGGMSGQPRVVRFAMWLGQGLCDRIQEREKSETDQEVSQ